MAGMVAPALMRSSVGRREARLKSVRPDHECGTSSWGGNRSADNGRSGGRFGGGTQVVNANPASHRLPPWLLSFLRNREPDGSKFCDECGTPFAASARPVTEQRKVVTAPFCDLVGFTATSESADPEDVDTMLAAYFAMTRRQAEAHGGVGEKFIGDAVVGVFGVPAAHEDDPERAVRAGVRICEDAEELTSVGVHLWGPAPRRPAKAATRAPDVDGHASDGAALKLDLAGVHSSTDPTPGQKTDRLNHGAHLLLGLRRRAALETPSDRVAIVDLHEEAA